MGKQRLEKDMYALPPGLSTRCISRNTWGQEGMDEEGVTTHYAAALTV